MTIEEKAEALREKHGTWGEHPDYPFADWQREVEEDSTRLGYWQWVANKIDLEQDGPGETTPRRILVACRDANGIPTLYPTTVAATNREVEDGQHYPMAQRAARDAGYELPNGQIICVDTEDAEQTGFLELFGEFFCREDRVLETGRLLHG